MSANRVINVRHVCSPLCSPPSGEQFGYLPLIRARKYMVNYGNYAIIFLMEQKAARKKLPLFFKPILWSYDFDKFDAQKNQRVLIVNTINYGNLKHWKWISEYYGKNSVRGVLKRVPESELRLKARLLASILFSIDKFDYASRSVKC